MVWIKTNIKVNNLQYEAIAPLIVSASRATDIPAFFAREFMQAIERGYIYKTNPFNHKKHLISFSNTRLIVFWTKNPAPIMPYLNELDKKNINYYFQFTLNDYAEDGLEPFVPKLIKRIETFKKLSKRIGKGKVIWRFDPVLLLKNQKTGTIVKRIDNIANELSQDTEKLVFSFADLSYRKVQNNLKRAGIEYHDFTDKEKLTFATELVNQIGKYKLKIASCAQKIDLQHLGITYNKCIDDELIVNLFPRDKVLMDFIKPNLGTNKLTDKGQRKHCNCIYSKDIGAYNTCSFLCNYCYANTSSKMVEKNKTKIFN